MNKKRVSKILNLFVVGHKFLVFDTKIQGYASIIEFIMRSIIETIL